MSTPNPGDGRDASEDLGELPADRPPSLPTFHSVLDDPGGGNTRTNTAASGSHSHRTGSLDIDPERAHSSERLSSGNNPPSGNEPRGKDNGREEGVRRHHSTRSSGGFLLEPVTSSKRLSLGSVASSGRGPRMNRDGAISELLVSKRRHRDNGHAESSFRSSPLSSEVRQDLVTEKPVKSELSSSSADVHDSPSSSRIAPHLDENVAVEPAKAEAERGAAERIGYDQDPAQIVNMALTLSEGRRRLASGRRYASMEQGERRVISTSSTANPRSTVKNRSIAPFLGSTRPSSRTGSPKPRFSALFHEQRKGSQVAPTESITAGSEQDSDADVDLAEEITPATAARVEKAKAYFELAYEHRRLLPHLPPIRRPGTRPSSTGPEAFQKAYNPLQYVRNRKLRVWEKTPIDSEADGWHDVPRVRTWVDAAIASHPETQHDSVECVRLPPFDQASPNIDDGDSALSPDKSKSTPASRISDQFHARALRPRSDWVTHPADLLADAYWLEQGMNKTKIQDRDNNLIYPPDTHFNFSGWRNTSPMNIPARLQQPSPPPEPDRDVSEEPPPSALPELPTFTSALPTHRHGHLGRRRDRLKDTLQINDPSNSRERSRLRRKLFQDSSESEYSESTSSGEDIAERGRKRLRRKRHQSPGNGGYDSQSHPKKTSQMLGAPRGDSSQGSSAPNSKRSSVDHGALNKLFNVDHLMKASPLNRSRNRHESSQPGSINIASRSSLDNDTLPRASTEYDTTTAPNSPNGVQWPSIAINLSPPASRSSSRKRKSRSAILHPFHRKHHKEHVQVSATDFAHVPPSQSTQNQAGDVEKRSDSPWSRGTSPMTRGSGPFSTNSTHTSTSTQPDRLAPQSTNDNGWSGASKVSTRSTNTAGSDHSKVRGIFKGGRIAEIVGNEVSRVGDFIWKRDPPPLYKHRGSASTGTLRSYYGSDSEKETVLNGALSKTPPTKLRSRSSTVSSTKSERLSPVSTKVSPPSGGRPRYNNPNLPSFTSPFQKDREEQEKKQALLTVDDDARMSDSGDHISRLAAQHRSASHSPRLDRIALPKLDTAQIPPVGDDRKKSYGFGAALDLSRPRDASDLLNTAIGSVNHAPLRATKSTGDLTRADGSDDGQDSSESADVSWRDISRAAALLYSSTVKAREIGRRADEDTELPKFLLDTLTPENQALHSSNRLRVKKRERHIVAAQNVMKTLDRHSSTFNDKLHWFSSSMAPNLHTQLQMLEDMVENTMTPKVRITADKAGELSMKLTTTSTLAVKELNDSIDAAFRRRRRGPIRLLRRVWFAGIEWTVVGVLWFIWAVVSLIQLALAVTRGAVTTIKWLLWIV